MKQWLGCRLWLCNPVSSDTIKWTGERRGRRERGQAFLSTPIVIVIIVIIFGIVTVCGTKNETWLQLRVQSWRGKSLAAVESTGAILIAKGRGDLACFCQGALVLLLLLPLQQQASANTNSNKASTGSSSGTVLRGQPSVSNVSGIPVYVAGHTVRGTPKEVHAALMSARDGRVLWDGANITASVLERQDHHVDIVHMVQKPVFYWPFWCQPRDCVCLRYWAREADGSYVIVLQSTEHPAAPPRKGTVRADVMQWTFLICPMKPEYRDRDHVVQQFSEQIPVKIV